MNLLKKISIGLFGFIAILLLVAAFLPKSYTIEREVIINKPKQTCFDYVKVLRNQKNFSTWESMDPNMKQSYSGNDGEVGSSYAWDGNPENVGKGKETIKSIKDGERIDVELAFEVPYPSISDTYFTLKAIDSTQTKVLWGMKGDMPYPTNLMQLLMNMEQMIGDEYAKSLTNLKNVLEKTKLWLNTSPF